MNRPIRTPHDRRIDRHLPDVPDDVGARLRRRHVQHRGSASSRQSGGPGPQTGNATHGGLAGARPSAGGCDSPRTVTLYWSPMRGLVARLKGSRRGWVLAGVAVYALLLMVNPVLHDDLAGHLKSPAHCKACTASPTASRVDGLGRADALDRRRRRVHPVPARPLTPRISLLRVRPRAGVSPGNLAAHHPEGGLHANLSSLSTSSSLGRVVVVEWARLGAGDSCSVAVPGADGVAISRAVAVTLAGAGGTGSATTGRGPAGRGRGGRSIGSPARLWTRLLQGLQPRRRGDRGLPGGDGQQ